jgi:post-segregation antitoxin (ccd killing protein)
VYLTGVPDKYAFEVREPLFVADAPRQTVSLTINSDLFARAKSLGINASRIAEEALVRELERRRAAALTAEIQADVAATDELVEKHGSFAAMVRAHYRQTDDDPV